MIKVYQTHPGHFDLIKPKEVFAGEKLDISLFKDCGDDFVRTIYVDNEVAAIMGGNLIWPGVGKIWAITSDVAKKSPIGFHRAVLDVIEKAKNCYTLHRVQMSVRTDYVEGVKWATALGFHVEGKMWAYGPDKADYFLFAKVW